MFSNEREKEDVDLSEWGGRKDLRGVVGGETIIRIKLFSIKYKTKKRKINMVKHQNFVL